MSKTPVHNQTVYNILHIMTLFSFKVLYPKLMLNAFCIYCHQAITLTVFLTMQIFAKYKSTSVMVAYISEVVRTAEDAGKFEFFQILI